MVQETLFEFGDGLGSPRAGMQHVHGLAGQAKIHGNHAELEAAPTLKKDHSVVVGDGEEAAQLLLRRRVDALVFGRAVAHFHDGHAAASPIEELFANALEYGKRQGCGAGIEIENTFGGRNRSGRRTHGNLILSNRLAPRPGPSDCLRAE